MAKILAIENKKTTLFHREKLIRIWLKMCVLDTRMDSTSFKE